MTREQIQVVESTWRQVAEIKEQAAELFYGKLFELVGAALLWTLERGLGSSFTPEVRAAWASAYGLLAGVMKAAAQAKAVSHIPWLTAGRRSPRPARPVPQPAHKTQKENGMKNGNPLENQAARRILLRACATALAVALAVSLPQPTYADNVTPPPVPSNIEVSAGNKVFLKGHAVGTQDYICLPTGWTLFGPQATLFNEQDKQVITHFLSPNPDQGGTPGATWQHSRDTSSVWAMKTAESSDLAFVAPGAIPWFRLEVVGAEEGPTGGHKLTATTFIHRLNTSGGVKPSTDCTEVGKKELVPYTADYFFYKATNRH